MTDRYIERKGRKLKDEELYPNSAKAKEQVARIQKLLMSKGMLEGTAYETALQVWRITRRS